MSKVITSPVDKWPGTVTLHDPLTFPQVLAFQDALDEARALGGEASVSKVNYTLLPGIFQCVETWELDGIGENPTPDTFPASPALSSAKLISWLIEEVTALFQEANEVPLAD